MIGWLAGSESDLPESDSWLTGRERETLAAIRIPKRIVDWRLGRLVAKTALAAQLGKPLEELEVIAAPDGAPEAFVHTGRGRFAPAGVSISLSHRDGRALAVIADPPSAIGCDIELIEERAPAFVREWFTETEQVIAAAAGEGHEGDAAITLIWAAKESVLKSERAGLRRDPLSIAVIEPGTEAEDGTWSMARVIDTLSNDEFCVWWRISDAFVLTVAVALTDQADAGPPTPLAVSV